MGFFDRKKGEKMIDLNEYGYNPSFFEEESIEMIPARVTATHKSMYEIICAYGFVRATLKAGVYYNDTEEAFPTTGDFVLVNFNESGTSQIVKTGRRKSLFKRKSPDGDTKEQTVAANFDYVFIMTSLNKELNINRIDRYLALAWESGAVPLIVLTKADLVPDHSEILTSVMGIAGIAQVVVISVVTGQGIEQLSEYLKPQKTAVFLGSSGVGKSSLVNYLEGQTVMHVTDIREDDSKGRHTTTHRQLLKLKSGAMVIDTPGMRELGLWDAAQGLSRAFADIEELTQSCRFANCTHTNEPGCAVLDAISLGEIDEQRWQSYSKLCKENQYLEDKNVFMKQKQQWGKMISKRVKHIKKHGRH
jgi:ribosome biogenesis GTPase